jgi:hypothetical protein
MKTVRIGGVFSGVLVEWDDEGVRIRCLGSQDKELKLVHTHGPHDFSLGNFREEYGEEEAITHKMIKKEIKIGVDDT